MNILIIVPLNQENVKKKKAIVLRIIILTNWHPYRL